MLGIIRIDGFKRRLLDGERTFPLEDSGGVYPYLDAVGILEGGDDPEGRREFLGDWNPDRLDLARARAVCDR